MAPASRHTPFVSTQWCLCLSGTPLQRGLEDAYGLLLFLCVDPYFVHEWWRRLLLQPYCHGHKVRNINL